MQLNDMQRQFTALLFSTPDAIENPPEEFAKLFAANDIPLTEQLKVYRNHVVISLSEAVAVTFPLVEKLAGKEFLMDAAKVYLREHPPVEACLDRYGGTFAEFLRSAPQANAYPYLADAARLDWAINDCKCAKDDKPLKPEDLAAIPQDSFADTVFGLRDCVKLIQSPYPLHDIYNYSAETDELPDMNREGATYLLVMRVGLEVKIFNLNGDEFLMFSEMQEKRPLGECLNSVLERFPDFDFANFLQNYMALETFLAMGTN